MATKPYPPIEETPQMVNEPAVAYQRTDPSTYQGTAPGEPISQNDEETLEAFMNADLSELGDGFRPFTMAELNRWMDEVEAEDEEDAVPHEEVMRKMRELPFPRGTSALQVGLLHQ